MLYKKINFTKLYNIYVYIIVDNCYTIQNGFYIIIKKISGSFYIGWENLL